MMLRLSFAAPTSASTSSRIEERGLAQTVLGVGRRRGEKRSSCVSLACSSKLLLLRTQLDQLQAEAEATTAKAKSARLRVARLSEVAEQLQRRAAMYVESGKEDDARGLLSMKKKIMVGLNKSKNRTELFEKLVTKLDQAISLKELQIGMSSSHNAFLEREDRLLKQIEADFRIASIEEEDEMKQKQIVDIREDIARIREKISDIIHPSMID